MNNICNYILQFLGGCNLSSLFSGFCGTGNSCGFGNIFGGNCQ